MIGENDCACSLNETELFDPVNKQIVLDKGQWVDVHPLNNLSPTAPIEFLINGSTDELIDFNNTYLHLRMKVCQTDGTNTVAADDYAPVNNWGHSAFQDVVVTIGDTQIEGGNQTYPYKAYLTNLLTHSRTSKTTHLQTAGWFKDTTAQMNTLTNANKGYNARKTITATSTTVELCVPLILDIFMQNKMMLHNIDIKLKLTPSRPEFQLMKAAGGNNIKVDYESAVLYVRRVKAYPSFINSIEERLNLQNAIYPIQRTELITYTIPTGVRSHNRESLFRGQMPKALFIGLVRNDAFNGAYLQNPFNFQNNSITSLALYREGESIPCRPYTPNFTNNWYKREYVSLMQAIDMFNKNDDIDITPQEFADGYTIFGFNLTPDLAIAGHAQPVRDGNIRLEIKFGAATTAVQNVVAMGIFDSQIQITKYRNVIVDWKS